jgi:hypothetical protein
MKRIIGNINAKLFSSMQLLPSQPNIRINPSDIAKAVISENDKTTPIKIL